MGEELSETKRKSRNLSEKRRRDSFNVIVSELAAAVAPADRKLDKSNVLKHTISFLRKHNENITSTDQDLHKPAKGKKLLTSDELCTYLQRTINAYLLVISSSGSVVYASGDFRDTFKSSEVFKEKVIFSYVDRDSGDSLKKLLNDRSKTSDKSEDSRLVSLQWNLEPVKETSGRSGWQPYTVVGKFLNLSYIDGRESAVHFCCIVTPKAFREGVPEPVKGNIRFHNKFDAEWKFTCLDSCATNVIGYIPFEILGISGYDFYHPDDLPQIVEDQEKVMANGEGLLRPYRFRTKADRWVLLQTKCYISTCGSQLLRSIECVNQVLSDVKDKQEPRVSRFVVPTAVSICATKSADFAVTHVLHPQPGVSIEHSPLPAVTRNPIDITNEEERMLCQQLIRRQTNLQHQIALYQEELHNLQNKLMLSIRDSGGGIATLHTSTAAPAVSLQMALRPAFEKLPVGPKTSSPWPNSAPCNLPRPDPEPPTYSPI